jgi:sulfur-oxidizing protein SoxX
MRATAWALCGAAWLIAMYAGVMQASHAAGRDKENDGGDSRDAIRHPLTTTPGDAVRGRQWVVSREGGHCVLCHAVPGEDVKFTGTIGPPFAGVGSRLDAAQIRRRIVDITVLKPDAVMPAFHRTQDLSRVASPYRGQPILTGQQVEDMVAYLSTLKDAK